MGGLTIEFGNISCSLCLWAWVNQATPAQETHTRKQRGTWERRYASTDADILLSFLAPVTRSCQLPLKLTQALLVRSQPVLSWAQYPSSLAGKPLGLMMSLIQSWQFSRMSLVPMPRTLSRSWYGIWELFVQIKRPAQIYCALRINVLLWLGWPGPAPPSLSPSPAT